MEAARGRFVVSFSSKGTGQLIAIRGIKKSEDYIKFQDENLQLCEYAVYSYLHFYVIS